MKKSKVDQGLSVNENTNECPPKQFEPTVNDKDSKFIAEELKTHIEDTHAVPSKYQSPYVVDASESQHLANTTTELQMKIGKPASSKNASHVMLKPAPVTVSIHGKTSTQHNSKFGNYSVMPHLATMRWAMKDRMTHEAPDDPAEHMGKVYRDERRAQEEAWRIEAITRAKTLSDLLISPSNSLPLFNAGTPTSTTPETSIPPDIAEAPIRFIANTTCSSPDLQRSDDPMRNKNPLITDFLLIDSLDDPSLREMSGRDAPPPDGPDDLEGFQDVQDAILHSFRKGTPKEQDTVVDADTAVPGKHKSRMLRELESTLKVAEETPKRRTTASYEKLPCEPARC